MLKDTWTDKQDGVDIASAEDINSVANAVVNLETSLGDISTALDNIIALQNSYIGGVSA